MTALFSFAFRAGQRLVRCALHEAESMMPTAVGPRWYDVCARQKLSRFEQALQMHLVRPEDIQLPKGEPSAAILIPVTQQRGYLSMLINRRHPDISQGGIVVFLGVIGKGRKVLCKRLCVKPGKRTVFVPQLSGFWGVWSLTIRAHARNGLCLLWRHCVSEHL